MCRQVGISTYSTTESETSMLPRVALEYGHTLCAASTNDCAVALSSLGAYTTRSALSPNPPSPSGPMPMLAETWVPSHRASAGRLPTSWPSGSRRRSRRQTVPRGWWHHPDRPSPSVCGGRGRRSRRHWAWPLRPSPVAMAVAVYKTFMRPPVGSIVRATNSSRCNAETGPAIPAVHRRADDRVAGWGDDE